ncbi:unnamed protein product [Mucor hiemalis]
MQKPPLLQLKQTSDDTLIDLTRNLINDETTWIIENINSDDSPACMHENVTSNNSPNQQHVIHQKPAHHHNYNNFNQNYRVTNYGHELSPPSFTSSLLLNSFYNSSSSSASKQHQSHNIIIPQPLIINALPPVITKESVSSQSNSLVEAFDPYIDDFEIVRTKVTDIMRTMQRFHISELEQQVISPSTSEMIDQLDVRSTMNRPLSPLSILCPTTNSLIQTRLLEETGSYCDNEEDEDQEDEEDDSQEISLWRNEFLNLMSNIIGYSEDLESISTGLLKTEGRVRELVVLQKSLIEELEEQERQYTNKIEECERISQQQLFLIENLIELDQDLDMTQAPTTSSLGNDSSKRRSVMTNTTTNTTTTTTTLSTAHRWQSSEHSQGRGIFNKSYSTSSITTVDSRFLLNNSIDQQPTINTNSHLTSIDTMEDIVQKLRWEIGLRIGGSVGNGHVIHSFESPLNGIELIIAGFGATEANQEEQVEEESYIQSSTIQHIRFHKHHYMLHINHQDRVSRFTLLPKKLWTPDEEANQCQFKSIGSQCSTKFNFFQRRHHCRRCGIVICQRHSLNRLPLFSQRTHVNNEKWYRVCDTCFHDLVIVTKKKKQYKTYFTS